MRQAILFAVITSATTGSIGFIAWSKPVNDAPSTAALRPFEAKPVPSATIQQVDFDEEAESAEPSEYRLAQRGRFGARIFGSKRSTATHPATDGPPSTDDLAPVGTALRKPPANMPAIETPPLKKLRQSKPSPRIVSGGEKQESPPPNNAPPLVRPREPGSYEQGLEEGDTIEAPSEAPPRQMMLTQTTAPYRTVAIESPQYESSPIIISRTQPHGFDDEWYVPIERITPAMAARRDRIRQLLDFYFRRPLNTKEHSPWSIMHTMIGWGIDAQVRADGPQGRMVNATTWLTKNGTSDGVQLLTVNKGGDLRAKNGPGLQGHDAQFLAMLAQTRIDPRIPLNVGDEGFDIVDLIRVEQDTCKTGAELTFKLIGLAHYLPSDATWEADGSRWDIPRLIRAEIAAPINGVTCGGTHRLMSLKYAVRKRRAEGRPVDGQWARAEKYTSDYIRYSLALQNRDGCFSSNFYRGKGDWGDKDRKMKTTGHVLELVLFCVPHDQLQDRGITAAVDYLYQLMARNRYYDWPKGPLGHALRALSLYDERVYGRAPGHRTRAVIAQRAAQDRVSRAQRN